MEKANKLIEVFSVIVWITFVAAFIGAIAIQFYRDFFI